MNATELFTESPTEVAAECHGNKTPLTHAITDLAEDWLLCRGFKPAAREVYVCRGWIADIAGICCPTQTEAIDLKLMNRGPRNDYHGRRDRFAALPARISAIVEVKVSKSDYYRDVKKKFSATWSPSMLRYLAMPAALIPENKWPEGWGILCYYESAGIRLLRTPTLCATPSVSGEEFTHELAVRFWNDQKQSRQRERQKSITKYFQGQKQLNRMSTLTEMFIAISRGEHGTLEECVEYFGVKNIPSYRMKRMQEIWGIVKSKPEAE